MRTQPPHRSQSLEEIFTAKHAWLLRWALHFSGKDLNRAEDLVQDVFVRLLLCWDSIRDRQDIEPLLYSFLKYAHLTQLRRGRAYSFQSLASVDFDTLFLGMRIRHYADRLDLQNELRRIVVYLIRRKRTAKFASICLLRFFHGFSPEQVMDICRVSRHAVDLCTRYARKEIRAHLLGNDTVGASTPSALSATHTVISPQALTEELRAAILTGRSHICWRSEQLQQRYGTSDARPLDCEILSHLVSCEGCLEYVAHWTNVSRAVRPLTNDDAGSVSRSRCYATNDVPATPAMLQDAAAASYKPVSDLLSSEAPDPKPSLRTYPLLAPKAFKAERSYAPINHAHHP